MLHEEEFNISEDPTPFDRVFDELISEDNG